MLQIQHSPSNGGYGLVGSTGLGATVYPFGELNTEQGRDDVSVQFQYPYYNTEFDLKTAVVVGGATAAVGNGSLTLTSTGSDSVIVESKDPIRYKPGHAGYAYFTCSFSGSGIGTIGALAVGKDGFFIRVSNGVMTLGYIKSGSEYSTSVQADGFFPGGNIRVSSLTLTNINIFEIIFGYLGVANPVFMIKFGGTWHKLGEIQTEGLLTTTHVNNPVLPIGLKAQGAMVMKTASWRGGKLGDSEYSGSRFFSSDSSVSVVSTTKSTFGTFKNNTTFEGVENRVKAKLLRYAFSVDAPATGYGTVQFRIEKNATLSGIPSYSDISLHNSVMQIDTTATYGSGGKTIFVEHIEYASSTGSGSKSGGNISQQADAFGLYLLPGETATITAQNVSGSTTVTARIVFNWVELF